MHSGMNGREVLLIPVVFIVVFPLLWCGICLLLSRLGGWGELAAVYPAREPVTGPANGFAAALFRWSVRYKGCLTFTAAPAGLHLAVWPIFRPGHPPLLIPWREITAVETSGMLVIGPLVELVFAQTPGITMRISRRLFARLAEQSGRLALTGR